MNRVVRTLRDIEFVASRYAVCDQWIQVIVIRNDKEEH